MIASATMLSMLATGSFAGGFEFGNAGGIALVLSFGLLLATFFLVLSARPTERRQTRLATAQPVLQH